MYINHKLYVVDTQCDVRNYDLQRWQLGDNDCSHLLNDSSWNSQYYIHWSIWVSDITIFRSSLLFSKFLYSPLLLTKRTSIVLLDPETHATLMKTVVAISLHNNTVFSSPCINLRRSVETLIHLPLLNINNPSILQCP